MIVLQFLLFISCVFKCCGVICQWDIANDFAINEPILIKRSNLIVANSTQGLRLSERERFTVACPGPKNYIKLPKLVQHTGSRVPEKVSAALIACAGGKRVNFGGKVMSLKEIECKKPVVGDVHKSEIPCAEGKGRYFEIGFYLANKTYEIITACYDATVNLPIYTAHILHGSSLGAAHHGSDRPDFKHTGLTDNIPWEEIYTKKTQKVNLEQVIGHRVDEFISDKFYLARGHLSPTADFVFKSWQHATFFYANVVPQWQSINAGNWVRIENSLRKLAITKQLEMRIITGTYNSLYLPDENNNFVKVYLYGNNVPVPEYLWKVACVLRSKKCIGFITMNNPYATFEKPLCTDICKENNWFHPHFRNFLKGLTYCCEVREMMASVPVIPALPINGILKGLKPKSKSEY